MINTINSAVSGLLASKKRAEVAAANIAGASTTGKIPAAGEEVSATVHRPIRAETISNGAGGVTTRIVEQTPQFQTLYAPSDPNSNEDGLVLTPNVSFENEFIELIMAENAYKANIAVLKTQKETQDELLNTLA